MSLDKTQKHSTSADMYCLTAVQQKIPEVSIIIIKYWK